MPNLATFVQALVVGYASGVSVYATVALLGLMQRAHWIGPLPGLLGATASWFVIVIAGAIYIVEFLATLIPGVASAWETFQSLIRPPAAAILAAATAWDTNAGIVLAAALLGGGFALTTHATKLGLRYAIDTVPEPASNGIVNVAELSIVATIVALAWHHPYVTLLFAILVLIALAMTVRLIWRALRLVFTGRWMPSRGLPQEPRASARIERAPDED